MDGTQPSGICPHCGGPAEYQSQRYPRALCHACCERVTCLEGRAVTMGNVALSGGFVAHHRDDGSVCEQLGEMGGAVLVDGARYRASEAHMGGVVVQPDSQ